MMTSTKAPRRALRGGRARRVTAWTATLALAAGMAVNSPHDAHAASGNGSSAMQAWGENQYGQTDLPFDLRSGLKTVTRISLGKYHGVAATSDKKLHAWGDNVHGEGVVPDYLQNLGTIDVAAGNGFNVVLGDDFNARVWGYTPDGLDSVPAAAVAANLLEVAAGNDHALAKSSAGKVYAWGNNAKGQTTIPSAVANTTVQALAAGDGFSLALTSAGRVLAWGDNSLGQTSVPSALDGKKVVQIAAGARHALALTSDNQIIGWGSNAEGALNVPALAPGDAWLQIAAGEGFSAGVAKDSPTAGVWGSGATGIRKPPAPSGSHPVSVVAGGQSLIQGFRRLGVSAAPSIAGDIRAGVVLTGTHATFGPTDDVTKTGEWLKVTNHVVTTVGTGMTYTPTTADVGSTLVFRTNASHPIYGTAYADTPQVEIKGRPFTEVSVPSITGFAHVGATLRGTMTSKPAADSFRFDWYADGVYRSTSDARGEYVVQEADLGKRITLLGYADKVGYERFFAGESAATAPVTIAPDFEVEAPPAVTGTPRVGTMLRVTPARTTTAPATTSYQWYRDGRPITGATRTTYRAAQSDAGKRLGVIATLRGPGHAATETGSMTVRIAKVTPTLGWSARQGAKTGSKRKVTIAVTVRASGVPPLGGTLKIRDGGTVLKTLSLQKGRRTYTVKLSSGRKHAVRVTYDGTTGVTARSSQKTLTIR